MRSVGVLLAAHGSRGGTGGNANIDALADALRQRKLAAAVQVGYLKGEPDLGSAVRRLSTPEVLVYPMMLADGDFARRVEQTLESVDAGERQVAILSPLGLDPGLVDLVAEKAAAALPEYPSNLATVVLIAHGSSRNPASGEATRRLAGRLAAPRRFARVLTAFLDEAPSLEEVLASVAGPTVIVGLFVSDGRHGHEVLSRLIVDNRRPDLAYAGNVGGWPEIADVVADAIARASCRIPGRSVNHWINGSLGNR